MRYTNAPARPSNQLRISDLSRPHGPRPIREGQGKLPLKIRGITNQEVRSVIEAAQPFSRGDGREHPLWVLHQLDIQDKHRLLTPVASVPLNAETKATVSWPGEGQHDVEMSAPIWIPFSDRMEVVTIRTTEPAEKGPQYSPTGGHPAASRRRGPDGRRAGLEQ